ncbi:hypothetical protein NP493_13g06015 [Ridgeia piscesae]|uniref:Uncharacterized protein n=1 Tax=Ridgeia piscesae TaxID=27915 RepID=A0AAD9PF63_RIDPI|nr:hypothetical protein NP493_13g06015 [Ridgeia piscesae]
MLYSSSRVSHSQKWHTNICIMTHTSFIYTYSNAVGHPRVSRDSRDIGHSDSRPLLAPNTVGLTACSGSQKHCLLRIRHDVCGLQVLTECVLLCMKGSLSPLKKGLLFSRKNEWLVACTQYIYIDIYVTF